MDGDADIAAVAALFADDGRAKILLALGTGGRSASVLAAEAGVAASTASAHLGKLVDGGLLSVLAGGDGSFDPRTTREDRLSAPGFDLDYRLTAPG